MGTTSVKNKGKGIAKAISSKKAIKPAAVFKLNAAQLKERILHHLRFTLARDIQRANGRDWSQAINHTLRELVLGKYIETYDAYRAKKVRRVHYLSLEYLMGRLMDDTLHNTGLFKPMMQAIEELGLDYPSVEDEERDMGLGNGGLGRLAACFLDSMATLNLPAIGYGIHYEYGLFKQSFENGRQIETADNWQKYGNPWQIMRAENVQTIELYGHVEKEIDDAGNWRPVWKNTKQVVGMPWDVPIVGYGGQTVNALRLWEARSDDQFNFSAFNEGGYTEAVRQKSETETISKVLYPNDTTESGKELRLVQQYFFVSCSLKDILARFKREHGAGQVNTAYWNDFPTYTAIQLNDTHPAVAVPELMRLLLDEENLGWDKAWELCRATFAYTNHTLLPEALEKWSVPLFGRVLPRHLEIVYAINQQFLEQEVEAKWPGNGEMKAALSIIEEGQPQMLRMAYLSVVASHTVNGVAAMHTELLKKYVLADFNELYPGKIQNKTNGITPRRWLKACNQGLSQLIDSKLGPNWPTDLDSLQALSKYAEDATFQEDFMAVKRANKVRLAEKVKELCGVNINPDALFDVQIKRLHEYKRQHLNLLHILHRYRTILNNPQADIVPRVFIFGAKAAPGYWLAKEIIYAINRVAEKINNDARVGDKLKVVFLPNYGVSLAELMIPAADISEQISTAGKEASGTGNMKLALNGSLTVGTLDGANVEIKEEVGEENIFIFGLNVDEVHELKANGYNPWEYYKQNEDLKAVLDWLGTDAFTPGEGSALNPVRESLLEGADPYLVCADFADYCRAQAEADKAFKDTARWAKMAILNTARMGKFSSDRTISQYANEIWNLKPFK